MRRALPAALRDERGMTLVEILVVIIILAILLAFATASYRGYQQRANDTSAQSNIHSLVPSIHAYYVDHESYAGMTFDGLRANYDAAVDPTLYSFWSVAPTDNDYCVQTSVGDRTWRKNGPTAELERQACP